MPNSKTLPNGLTTAMRAARSSSKLDDILLQIVDAGFIGCLFVVPFMMGGRQALGQFSLATLSVVVALAWMVRQCLTRISHQPGTSRNSVPLLRQKQCGENFRENTASDEAVAHSGEKCGLKRKGLKSKATWRVSGVETLLIGALLLLLLQITPLPESVIGLLSSHTQKILPLWTAQADPNATLGVWSYLSLTPADTRSGLILFLSYSLLFLIVVQRIRSIEDIERLLRWCAFSVVAMASFGLIQLFTNNGKFLWCYEHPFSDTSSVAKGCFTNRNHFAHFLALGIGPIIWWIQDSLSKKKRRQNQFGTPHQSFGTRSHDFGFGGFALGIVLFAILLSLSRGGAIAMFFAAAVGVSIFFYAGRLSVRFIGSLAAIAVVIGIALSIFGYHPVSNRLDSLAKMSLESDTNASARQTAWGATLKTLPDFAIFGTGVGSFKEVNPMYWKPSDNENMLAMAGTTEFTHAENGPLQVGQETGATGLALLLTGIGLCVYWSVLSLKRMESKRLLTCLGAICASLTASVVHSFFDFVWYVPACVAMTCILAACLCRIFQVTCEKEVQLAQQKAIPQFVYVAATVVVAATGVWMITCRFGPVVAEPYWDSYRITSITAPNTHNKEKLEQLDQSEIDHSSLQLFEKMTSDLNSTVRWDPNNARAHMRLSGVYLDYFNLLQQRSDNAMNVNQIRDAAINSQFASKAALDAWLERAIGDNRRYLDLSLHHAQRSLKLCPLQGEGYMYLANLRFLTSPKASCKSAYIDQALKVRPNDGTVLFEAGQEAFIAGDYEQGLAFWQLSYKAGRVHQHKLFNLLAGRLPVACLLQTFEPDLHSLKFLYRRYKRLNQPAELSSLGTHFANATEAKAESLSLQPAKACKLWLQAYKVRKDQANVDHALYCVQKALQCDPCNYKARYYLGITLIDQHHYAEAEKHLRWCLQRSPGAKDVQRRLKFVLKKLLNVDRHTASKNPTPKTALIKTTKTSNAITR